MLRIAAVAAPARISSKVGSSSAARFAPRPMPVRKFAVEGVPSFHEREKGLEDEAVRRHERELAAAKKKDAEEKKKEAEKAKDSDKGKDSKEKGKSKPAAKPKPKPAAKPAAKKPEKKDEKKDS